MQETKVDSIAEVEEDIEDDAEQDIAIPYRYSITAYGADYPVDGLVKRVDGGDVVVPTFDPDGSPAADVAGFQRKFIWTRSQCERFVESLLLGFPVPGIFLVKQRDGRHLVLDGQQRLRTLQAFYRGVLRGQEFVLEDVQKKYQGRTYTTLEEEDRRRLDDSIIHATVVRQDEPSNDQSSIYMIFERLNTGGTTLKPQEIRVALYRGALIQLLRELNEHATWRQLFGKKSSALKDHELILRFMALLFRGDKYERPMKEFLNEYLESNQDCKEQSTEMLRKIFVTTVDTISQGIGPKAFRLKTTVNAALADAVMVGVARRVLSNKNAVDFARLRTAYDTLLQNKRFLETISKSTADEKVVADRLDLATKVFATA